MPELPEVEGVVRELAPEIIGRTIQAVAVSDVIEQSKADGKEAIIKGLSTSEFKAALEGMTITNVVRRSKYIYLYMSKEERQYLLVSHLGMTGAWFPVNQLEEVTEEKFRKHSHVIFEFTDGGLLVYSDIRRFGELRLLREEAEHPPLLKMAPEPFAEDALAYFLACTKESKYKKKPIKAVIMDGQVISGCGNIYATEALFKMNIHPNRATERISVERKKQLFTMVVDVLQESIERGGSTISDYRTINGGAGTMQNLLQMYGKKQCPACETETKSLQIAGRTSVYCPQCQK